MPVAPGYAFGVFESGKIAALRLSVRMLGVAVCKKLNMPLAVLEVGSLGFVRRFRYGFCENWVTVGEMFIVAAGSISIFELSSSVILIALRSMISALLFV